VGRTPNIAIFRAPHPFDGGDAGRDTLVDGIVYFDRARDDGRAPSPSPEAADDGRPRPGADGMAAIPLAAAIALAVAVRGPFAIHGARSSRVRSVIEKGTIVLSGGKIAAVGADAAVPADAEVVDGAGQRSIPASSTASRPSA